MSDDAPNRFRDPRELREEAKRLQATATAIEDGTWEAVVDGQVTSAQLAERLGCSVSGANNRLRALYDLRLVDRAHVSIPGGGRQFAYTWRASREKSDRAHHRAHGPLDSAE